MAIQIDDPRLESRLAIMAQRMGEPVDSPAYPWIVDLGLDVAQVSRILGHARITITLDTYTHLFDDARHSREIRQRMSGV